MLADVVGMVPGCQTDSRTASPVSAAAVKGRTWRLAEGVSYIVACEVQNGPGEGWVDPQLPSEEKLTKQQHMVLHRFEAMVQMSLAPMLAAPFVDPSFYRFQARDGGAHARYLYHVRPPGRRGSSDREGDISHRPPVGEALAQNLGLFVRRLPR